MTAVRKLTRYYSRRRFAILFFSLLTTMLAAPMFMATGYSAGLLDIFLSLNILAAAVITLRSFKVPVPIGLLVLAVGARVGYALLGYDPLLSASQGMGALICLLSLCIMLPLLFIEGPVESERIFAALDIYLLIGVICALVYCLLEQQWPGSFYFHTKPLLKTGNNLETDMLYFSFVTLATLGYGDITPVAGPARALAVFETISGQIYLVVVVARLVSLYQGKSIQNHGREDDAAFPMETAVGAHKLGAARRGDDQAHNHRSPARRSK